jgi:serine/threonine protein kinase
MNENPSGRPLRPAGREQPPDQQFWQLWRQGRPPDLRAFLTARSLLDPEQVAAVISIDQYERWLAGERIPAEDYLALLPAGPDADQAGCDVIYGEFLLREQLGEHPSLEEYRRRFPAHASLLSRQVELHEALASENTNASASQSVLSRTRITPHRHAIGSAPQSAPLAIPGYEILGIVGRGGMGVVYRARQVNLDRIVALKVLNIEPDSDPGALDRIRREARVMARLAHPHIVTVHDAGQAGHFFYVAMEYVAGVDLHRLVDQHGPLPVPQACEYIRQAALGLQHAHEHGLVHRDIKPSNLIVTQPVNTPLSQLKILDLGLARLTEAVEPASPAVPLTHIGEFMGTPDFIAPEQANDARTADIRSDLYSLGCTFFYVLTGQTPFTGATPLAKLMQHHITDAPSPQELRPDIPPAVSALIRRLMAKRPDDRFDTPADLAAALSALQGGNLAPAPVARPAPAIVPSPSSRGGLARRLSGHTDWVKCVAFAPEGNLIASGGLDGTLRLWSPRTSAETWRGEGQGHTSAVLCLAFSCTSRWLATGGQDRLLCLWDLEARHVQWRAAGHTDNINAVAFSGDGTRILTASHDGTLRLWDTASGHERHGWPAHDGPVWGAAITADGRRALSGGQDGMLRLWDVESDESLLSLPEQERSVTCVALTPDGRRALGGTMDGVVHLWDLTTQREILAFEGHTARVLSVAFSPAGTRAVSGSRDHSVRIWDTATGQEVCVFSGHTQWVTAVAWSPDGRQVVSGSRDRSLCVWDVPGE